MTLSTSQGGDCCTKRSIASMRYTESTALPNMYAAVPVLQETSIRHRQVPVVEALQRGRPERTSPGSGAYYYFITTLTVIVIVMVVTIVIVILTIIIVSIILVIINIIAIINS